MPYPAGTTWTPQPLEPDDAAAQARRELAAIAATRDAWSGTRDTDREA